MITREMRALRVESIYPEMLDLAVDNFDLEISNSGLDMLRLLSKGQFTSDISYGVLDVHTHNIEDQALIEDRLRKGLEVLPRESVWGDPDCGLKTRTVEEAEAKLQRMFLAAQALRGA